MVGIFSLIIKYTYLDNVKFAGVFVVDFEDFIIIQELCMVNLIILVLFLFCLFISLLWQASTLTACTSLLIISSQNQTQRQQKR